ncbi:MAG TPA: histidine kinase dimerization/phospho-acceptor domain-containing protein [Thermoanaerobaculia bacterium]|nr:histidine kinase dimerization/phospho-acceptor domain-containing protein [Thermoanaerobaculia bacterium]
MVETTDGEAEAHPAAAELELAAALTPGVLVLEESGRVLSADEQALRLLEAQDLGELASRGEEMRSLLAAATATTEGRPSLVPTGSGGRQLLCQWSRGERAGVRILLVSDPEAARSLAADLRLAAHLRALSQISPAVAHDLRAPINAMVFNIEILKETIAAGKAMEPAARERQLRYVGVLKDELARLHQALEIFLAQTSARGDRTETLDLREAVGELSALLVPPARKLQVQIASALPEQSVPVAANRYSLRQALLQVGLAALPGVARGGTLEVRLESRNGRALLAIGSSNGAERAPSPSFDLPVAGAYDPLRLQNARAILVEQGCALRTAQGAGGFEVEWPVSGKDVPVSGKD